MFIKVNYYKYFFIINVFVILTLFLIVQLDKGFKLGEQIFEIN